MIQREHFINIAGLLSGVSCVMLHDQFDDSLAFIYTPLESVIGETVHVHVCIVLALS